MLVANFSNETWKEPTGAKLRFCEEVEHPAELSGSLVEVHRCVVAGQAMTGI